MNMLIGALIIILVISTTAMLLMAAFLWKLIRIYLNEPTRQTTYADESVFRKDTDQIDVSSLR